METAAAPIVESEPQPQTTEAFDAAAYLRQNTPVEEGNIIKVVHVVGSFFRVNIFRPLAIGRNERGDLTIGQQGKVIWSRFLSCAIENVGGKIGPVVREAARQ
jgi:hypothetical protein